MKRRLIFTSITVIAFAVAFVLGMRAVMQDAGREYISTTGATPLEEMSWFETIDSERELEVLCGNSMRVVMEVIADEFQKRHGISVIFNFGGSAELLPLIEFGGKGDLYICHDPYASILEEKNLLLEYITVGRLKPVILVKRGNPKGIQGLADLGKEGVRIATVDHRYATAGKLFQDVLHREEWGEAVRGNIFIESRGHSDAVLSLLSGHVDAAVVWNFLAALYEDRLDMVDPGVEFGEEIRVTLCRLSTSQNEEAASKFMEFVLSEFAQEAFEKFGYIKLD